MASASYLMHYCQCLLPFWAIQIVLAKIEKSSTTYSVSGLMISIERNYNSDKISIKGAFFNPSPSLVSLLAIHTILCTKLKTLDGN